MSRFTCLRPVFVFSIAVLLSASAVRAAGSNDAAPEDASAAAQSYRDLLLADQPVAYWQFDDQSSVFANAADGAALSGQLDGDVQRQPGPRPGRFPLFTATNLAVAFSGHSGFVRVKDSGEQSPLDFGVGDTVSLEAWVNLTSIGNDQQVYIVGKGRTGNPGFAAENQNYAMRLRGIKGQARLSFLFRSAAGDEPSQFHRWNSAVGFEPGSGWHHVGVSYTFGEPKSIIGYVDGQQVSGSWDMAGATDRPPVVDNDELWIGSSMGGKSSSTFRGSIDEVAIYRHALALEAVMQRYRATPPTPYEPPGKLPNGEVLVEVLEHIPDRKSWDFTPMAASESFTEPVMALAGIPQAYGEGGLRVDRSSPFVLRLWCDTKLRSGKQRLLLRSRGAARLFVDEELVGENPFPNNRSDGHEDIYEAHSNLAPNLRSLRAGDRQQVIAIESDGTVRRLRLDVYVGGGKLRPEIGELSLSMQAPDGEFYLIAPGEAATALASQTDAKQSVSLTEDGWTKFAAERIVHLDEMNTKRRREAAQSEAEYWRMRHELARREASAPPELPAVQDDTSIYNNIDRFITARLEHAGEKPTELTDDWSFLRRVTLDSVGTIPTREHVDEFMVDQRPDRRSRLIDRLLEEPGWADHWTSYWQDVLGENPNIVNPTLNNTGPFRWWIHESLLDNKPMDCFVTELVMMQGSKYFGGPAGFGLATESDVPMAGKAHVLAQAFLGAEMKCARCHDAPSHPYLQSDLFSLGAMLKRGPLEVPKTSTISLSAERIASLVVNVTLKPGEKISPAWPLKDLSADELHTGVLRNSSDTREQLAARITSPRNKRFAQVIVNRVWHRYMGRGIVEPVGDWDSGEPSHPELLDYLAHELVTHGYDLKHVARLILNSHAYQRRTVADSSSTAAELFAGPTRRRMTAEQIVDSLFVAAGKPMRAEELNIDVDGSRAYDLSLNLGVPRRAWQFTSLSNERDRPSLSLPVAQSILDVLETFGWRGSRQNPLTVREAEATVLQPAILANGTVGRRVATLSDDGALTSTALAELTLDDYVRNIFLSILTREPTSDEQSLFVELLQDGFAARRLKVKPTPTKDRAKPAGAVSWSNHLSPEATKIKLEMERAARAGDAATERLNRDWRERAEDMIWALVNSPEFVFVP